MVVCAMPHYTITHEIKRVGTRARRTVFLPRRWIVREDGKEIGAFETEQEAIEYRDKLIKFPGRRIRKIPPNSPHASAKGRAAPSFSPHMRGAGGRLAAAEDTDMVKKAKQKKPKWGAKKVTTKAKSSAKQKTRKQKVARKPLARRRPARETQVVLGSESVETVQLKRGARTAAAGAGGGDFGGVSVVEGADSESPEELLKEGQTFEAGIVSGVENAPDPDQGEVRTHEVPQDDVPEEYDDKDRP